MKDIMKYMKRVGNSLVFNSNKLLAYIPERYIDIGFLNIGTKIEVFGIFEIKINDTETFGLHLPAIFAMEYSSIEKEIIDDVKYRVVELLPGNKFMMHIDLLKQPNLPYKMFREFMGLGYFPAFISYDQAAVLFDNIQEVCDFSPKVSHSTFEMIYAHNARNSKDLSQKYRLSEMKEPPAFIGTTNIEFGTDSTTTKITGSYFTNGMNAALTNESTQRYDLEDMLRQ